MEKYEQKSDCHLRIKNRHIKKTDNCDHFSFIFVGDACPLGGMPHRQNYKLVLLFFKQSQRTGTENQHEGYKSRQACSPLIQLFFGFGSE